jgi:hypothetical protein
MAKRPFGDSIVVGDLRYEPSPLRLGAHGGNQFTVGQQPPSSGPGLLDILAGVYRLAGGRGSETDKAAATGLLGAVTQGLTAPGQAARGDMVTNGDVWSTALDYGLAGAPMAAPEGAIRANSFRAFHGSPHTFDQFDLSKIGTGEGAQAYGHGLYFAQNENIARSYRDDLSGGGISARPSSALCKFSSVKARVTNRPNPRDENRADRFCASACDTVVSPLITR